MCYWLTRPPPARDKILPWLNSHRLNSFNNSCHLARHLDLPVIVHIVEDTFYGIRNYFHITWGCVPKSARQDWYPHATLPEATIVQCLIPSGTPKFIRSGRVSCDLVRETLKHLIWITIPMNSKASVLWVSDLVKNCFHFISIFWRQDIKSLGRFSFS